MLDLLKADGTEICTSAFEVRSGAGGGEESEGEIAEMSFFEEMLRKAHDLE